MPTTRDSQEHRARPRSPKSQRSETHKRRVKAVPSAVARDIETSLRRRTLPKGTRSAKLEEHVKRRGEKAWRFAQRRPSLTALLFGGVGMAAASLVGVGELGIGLIAAYSAYKVLRGRESAEQAVEELVHDAERL